jgi:hypothetical protein
MQPGHDKASCAGSGSVQATLPVDHQDFTVNSKPVPVNPDATNPESDTDAAPPLSSEELKARLRAVLITRFPTTATTTSSAAPTALRVRVLRPGAGLLRAGGAL